MNNDKGNNPELNKNCVCCCCCKQKDEEDSSLKKIEDTGGLLYIIVSIGLFLLLYKLSMYVIQEHGFTNFFVGLGIWLYMDFSSKSSKKRK